MSTFTEIHYDFVLHYGQTGRVYSQIYSTESECSIEMQKLITEFEALGTHVHSYYIRQRMFNV